MIRPPLLNQLIKPIWIVAVLFTVSCGGEQSTGSESDTFDEAEEQILKDISQIISDLPPPSVIPQTIQEIGAEFNPDHVSELHGLEDYMLDEDKAAMNLGIFSTDIGYLIAYDQVQESIEHMAACQKLAESLGVATAFDAATMQKYEEAIGDHERLTELLNETILNAEERLGGSDRLSMAAMVLTGSFVEGLYLAVSVAREYHTDDMDQATRDEILEPLIKLLLNQEKPLFDIIKLLKDIPQDDAIATVIAELSVLEYLYKGDLAEVEKGMQEDPNFVVTQDMLFDVSLEVARIRNEIVKVE